MCELNVLVGPTFFDGSKLLYSINQAAERCTGKARLKPAGVVRSDCFSSPPASLDRGSHRTRLLPFASVCAYAYRHGCCAAGAHNCKAVTQLLIVQE